MSMSWDPWIKSSSQQRLCPVPCSRFHHAQLPVRRARRARRAARRTSEISTYVLRILTFFDMCFAFRHRHLSMMRPSESVSSAGPILFSGPYSAPFLNLPSVVNLQTKAPTGANRVSQAIGAKSDKSKSSLSLCQRRGRRTEGVPGCSKPCQGRRKWDQSNEIERHRTT